MRKRIFYSVFIALAFFMTVAAIATGSYFSAGLAITEGMRSEILVLAPQDVENLIATQANREEAQAQAEGLLPHFTVDLSNGR